MIETENEIINEIFIDFDPSDDIKMKNRFLHLLLELNLSSSDDENSNNTSASYDDVWKIYKGHIPFKNLRFPPPSQQFYSLKKKKNIIMDMEMEVKALL